MEWVDGVAVTHQIHYEMKVLGSNPSRSLFYFILCFHFLADIHSRDLIQNNTYNGQPVPHQASSKWNATIWKDSLGMLQAGRRMHQSGLKFEGSDLRPQTPGLRESWQDQLVPEIMAL